MEKQKIKCSTKGHEEIDSIIFCGICKIYICNKCENFHSKLFSNHPIINLEKNDKEIFTGFCKEKEHFMKLEYFCKSHNQLCCAACLCTLKKNQNGKHKDCAVCFIEEIKDEKMNKIKENIKSLKELSNTLKDSLNHLKKFTEKINENKEELKLKIQKIFTQIRNALNNREDEILLQVDKKFEESYFNEEIIKDCENLPKKINSSIEESEILTKDYNDDKLCLFINNCLNIENNIKKINHIKESIEKSKESMEIEIKFNDENLNEVLNIIKTFGELYNNNSFKSSIINRDENKKSTIIKWIRQKINKNAIKFELIFKMSENGSKAEDFHKYCDDKGPTLTLIKTTKDKIFGGFTPLNWKIKGESPRDKSNQTFIFSINLMKKFDMISPDKLAIRYSNSVNYGDSDIYLSSNLKNGNSYANSGCNFLSNNKLELTGGKGESENFEAAEFEVFKVIY